METCKTHVFSLLNFQNSLFDGVFDDKFDHAHISRLEKVMRRHKEEQNGLHNLPHAMHPEQHSGFES